MKIEILNFNISLIRVLLIQLLLILPLRAYSQDYKELHLPKDLSFLKLNKSQKEAFKEILKRHRKELKVVHEKEEQWEERLKEEFIKPEFNKKKFIKESLKIKREIAKIEADFFEQVHSILTIKQRKKFIEYIEEWEVD